MQLIVFEPDGSIEYTRNPLADALFEGERKRVERMSIIEWSDHYQLFYIEWLTGPFKNFTFGHGPLGWKEFDLFQTFVDANMALYEELVADTRDCNQVFFKTYEGAVRFEVAFATFLREQGYSLQ